MEKEMQVDNENYGPRP